MSLRPSPENRFLTSSPGRIFAATALPMIVIMVMNGMLSVIDAVFLERFVGAQAMAAVGMAFPALMLTIALSTLVSCGNWFAVDGIRTVDHSSQKYSGTLIDLDCTKN